MQKAPSLKFARLLNWSVYQCTHWFSLVPKFLFLINIQSGFKKHPPDMFYKKAVPKNFTIFTGKNMYWSLFLNSQAYIKRRLRHRCFPVNIAKFLRTLILKNIGTAASGFPWTASAIENFDSNRSNMITYIKPDGVC